MIGPHIDPVLVRAAQRGDRIAVGTQRANFDDTSPITLLPLKNGPRWPRAPHRAEMPVTGHRIRARLTETGPAAPFGANFSETRDQIQ